MNRDTFCGQKESTFFYKGEIMLKAVFIDYTGTIMKEAGKDVEEMTMRLYKNSDIESYADLLVGKIEKV